MTDSSIFPLVDASWLTSRLDSPGIVVLDVRTPPAGGFVPGAVHSDYAKAGWPTAVDGRSAMSPCPASRLLLLAQRYQQL